MSGTSISLASTHFETLGLGDLKRMKFSGVATPGQEFHGNFVECSFFQMELKNIDLTRCDWKECRIRDALFVDCDLGHASFITNSFEKCRFLRCRFEDTDISDSEFVECEFVECDLSHIVVKSTTFKKCDFSNCVTSNRIIESSLLLGTTWHAMELEIGVVISNFGLKLVQLSDCKLFRQDPSRARIAVKPEDVGSVLDNPTVLERFRIAYFLTGAIDGDSEALEVVLDPRNWVHDAPIRASLGLLLTTFSQFLLEEFHEGAMPFYPLLRFHTHNFELLDWVAPKRELAALYQIVAGVHLTLTREMDGFFSVVQEISDGFAGEEAVHIAAEGPVDEVYFATLFETIGFSGVRVLSVRPRNSPVDLALTFLDQSWFIATVALLIACRTKFELTKQERVSVDSNAKKRKIDATAGGRQLIALQTGFLPAAPSEFQVNFRTVLPRSLLFELHLNINVGLFKRAREALLFMLRADRATGPDTPPAESHQT